jgi:sterol desaturase/sphingolipid hydroxylase (fatty acid hydroxylase superfamily)
MPSLRSIKSFVITNAFIIFLGLLEYRVMLLGSNIKNIVFTCIFTVIRNFFLIYAINYLLKNRHYMDKKRKEPIEKYYGEFNANVFVASLVESITILSIKNYIPDSTNIMRDIITFIPISFLFEIIFDFFHYWTHRFAHTNKYVYKYFHKKHHAHKHVIPIVTFYQHPGDILLSNTLPIILTLSMLRSVSLFQVSRLQFSLIIIYKSFVEISGHCGKKLYPTSSFPQFIWLPRSLQIELYAEDHNLHHTLNNCNYSKRFVL